MAEWILIPTANALPANAFSLGAQKRFEDQCFRVRGCMICGSDDSSCDITLPWKCVSPQHTKLITAQHGLEVYDLNNSPKTFINGEPITYGLARSGDIISINQIKLLVIGPEPNTRTKRHKSSQTTNLPPHKYDLDNAVTPILPQQPTTQSLSQPDQITFRPIKGPRPNYHHNDSAPEAKMDLLPQTCSKIAIALISLLL